NLLPRDAAVFHLGCPQAPADEAAAQLLLDLRFATDDHLLAITHEPDGVGLTGRGPDAGRLFHLAQDFAFPFGGGEQGADVGRLLGPEPDRMAAGARAGITGDAVGGGRGDEQSAADGRDAASAQAASGPGAQTTSATPPGGAGAPSGGEFLGGQVGAVL